MRIGIWWIPHHVVVNDDPGGNRGNRWSIVTNRGSEAAYRRAKELASCLQATSYDYEIWDDGEDWEMTLPHVMVKLEIPIAHDHVAMEHLLESLPFRLRRSWWPVWTCDECDTVVMIGLKR